LRKIIRENENDHCQSTKTTKEYLPQEPFDQPHLVVGHVRVLIAGRAEVANLQHDAVIRQQQAEKCHISMLVTVAVSLNKWTSLTT